MIDITIEVAFFFPFFFDFLELCAAVNRVGGLVYSHEGHSGRLCNKGSQVTGRGKKIVGVI